MTKQETFIADNQKDQQVVAPDTSLQEAPLQTLKEKAEEFNAIAKEVREAGGMKNKKEFSPELLDKVERGKLLNQELKREGARKKKLGEAIAGEQAVPQLIEAKKKAVEDVLDGGQSKKVETKDGILLESVGKRIQSIVKEARLPSEDYESTVGVYGGKMIVGEDGKMVWDRRGIISKIDKTGDAILRTYDEHVVKEPLKMLWRHPKLFLQKMFTPGTKRYRGNNEEVVANIERLGLGEYYGAHENGIEIKDQEVYKHGLALQDVYRSDLIESDKLKETDRFQALAEASKYIGQIHQKHGAIGEVLVSDIIFQEDEDGKLGKPVLNLPDIVFNKEKKISETDKKTTDMLDFLSSVFGEEYRRSQNLEDVDKALDTVLENYADKDIIALTESFIKRGRLTLQGDAEFIKLPESLTKKARGIFSQHNKARLAAKQETDGLMKEKIMAACERFLVKAQRI